MPPRTRTTAAGCHALVTKPHCCRPKQQKRPACKQTVRKISRLCHLTLVASPYRATRTASLRPSPSQVTLEIARYLVIAFLGLLLLRKAYTRLQLSRAKHPSLGGHAKMSRRLAR